MSAIRRATRVVLAALLVLIALPSAAPRAATSAERPGAARWHTPRPPGPVGSRRGQFTMLLGIDNRSLVGRPNAAILVQVHASTTSRTSFDEVIANSAPGNGLYTLPPMPVASLPRLHGDLVVTLGLSGSDVTPRIGISSHGVYPVEVSLTNTGTATASFITWLVVVANGDRPVDEPLMVSSIWQVVAPPARLPDDSVDPKVAAQMAPDGRLSRIADVARSQRRTSTHPFSRAGDHGDVVEAGREQRRRSRVDSIVCAARRGALGQRAACRPPTYRSSCRRSRRAASATSFPTS